jgi:hypothetical protein
MRVSLVITDFDRVEIEEEVEVEEGATIRVVYDREKDEFDWEVL